MCARQNRVLDKKYERPCSTAPGLVELTCSDLFLDHQSGLQQTTVFVSRLRTDSTVGTEFTFIPLPTGRQASLTVTPATQYFFPPSGCHASLLEPGTLLPRDHSKSMWVQTGPNQETFLLLKDLFPPTGPRVPSPISLGLEIFFAVFKFFLLLLLCVRDCTWYTRGGQRLSLQSVYSFCCHMDPGA